jgi:hypothetical protein
MTPGQSWQTPLPAAIVDPHRIPVKGHSVGRLAPLGLAFLVSAILAACSSGPAMSGPFGRSGGGPGMVCTWTPPGSVLTYGLEQFPNTGGTAKIQTVALVSPHDLRVVADWVVPITGTNLIGVHSGQPTGRGAPPMAPGIQWAQRQRADGATIRHTPGSDVINIVLVIKPSGGIGSAAGLDVYYTSSGGSYLLQFPIGIKIKTGTGCTSSDTKL